MWRRRTADPETEAFAGLSTSAATRRVVGASFYLEQREEEGEDAPPILALAQDGRAVLAVLDGLGGSGSTRYEVGTQTRTGAYIAARVARQAVERFAEEWLAKQAGDAHQDDGSVASLSSAIRHAIEERSASLPEASSRLRSSLLRKLPTTLAMVRVEPSRGKHDEWTLDICWCGDSRVFLLSPDAGLQQLTRDDVEGSDVLEKLRDDTRLTNVICADRDFVIHRARGDASAGSILIAATDGCFSYFQTPWHFEEAALASMVDADDFSEWSEALGKRIAAVAGDDATFAAVAVECADFRGLRDAFRQRRRTLLDEFVRPLVPINDALAAARRDVDVATKRAAEMEDKHRHCVAAVWDAYARNYEALVPQPKEDK